MDKNIRFLFDRMKDALLLVASSGKVLYANPAAHAILTLTIGDPVPGDWLGGQINAVQRGYLKLPLIFEIDLPNPSGMADRVRVTLLPSPARGNLLVLLTRTNTDNLLENEIGNLADMLDCEVRGAVQHYSDAVDSLLHQFEQRTGEDWDLKYSVAALSRKTEILTDRLKKISLLAATTRMTSIRGGERILVTALVDEALLILKPTLAEKGTRISYCGLRDSLPVIYGGKSFLSQALAGYLKYFIENDAGKTNVVISAKLSGNHVQLSVEDYEQPAPAILRAPPLSQIKIGQSTVPEFPFLTLALCKRVIKLNGGSVHLKHAGGKAKTILFVFPIGAPAFNHHELDLQQVLRYAQDLNTLMQFASEHPVEPSKEKNP